MIHLIPSLLVICPNCTVLIRRKGYGYNDEFMKTVFKRDREGGGAREGASSFKESEGSRKS